MKFRLEFISSPFITARIRISHIPGSSLPLSIEDSAGDMVSKIVDIRGDTTVDFSVPYISPYFYQPTMGLYSVGSHASFPAQYNNSNLVFSVINPPVGPDPATTSLIYYNLYVSAGEDFVFGGSTFPRVEGPISNVREQSLIKAFEKPFEGLIPAVTAQEKGVVLPEQYSTIEELCMAYTTLRQQAFADLPASVISETLVWNGQDADYAAFFGQCFRWNRGALRYKLAGVVTTNRFIAAELSYNGALPSYRVVADMSERSVLEFEIPSPIGAPFNSFWNASIAPDNTAVAPSWDFNFDKSDGTAINVTYPMRAVGDDFMFGHQIAMPTFSVEYFSKVVKNTGLSVRRGARQATSSNIS